VNALKVFVTHSADEEVGSGKLPGDPVEDFLHQQVVRGNMICVKTA